MPHPVPGIDYPESWRELLAWFPDDAACLTYLERLRWPAGFVCRAAAVPDAGGWAMGCCAARPVTVARRRRRGRSSLARARRSDSPPAGRVRQGANAAAALRPAPGVREAGWPLPAAVI